MKTCINISFPSKISFRKKVHSQASDHVWFFLNLFSKRPREKKKEKKEKKKKRREKKEISYTFRVTTSGFSLIVSNVLIILNLARAVSDDVKLPIILSEAPSAV